MEAASWLLCGRWITTVPARLHARTTAKIELVPMRTYFTIPTVSPPTLSAFKVAAKGYNRETGMNP